MNDGVVLASANPARLSTTPAYERSIWANTSECSHEDFADHQDQSAADAHSPAAAGIRLLQLSNLELRQELEAFSADTPFWNRRLDVGGVA